MDRYKALRVGGRTQEDPSQQQRGKPKQKLDKAAIRSNKYSQSLVGSVLGLGSSQAGEEGHQERRNSGTRVEPPKAQFATSPSVKSRPINASRQAQGTSTKQRHQQRHQHGRRAAGTRYAHGEPPQLQVPARVSAAASTGTPRDEACVRYKTRWKRALEPGAKSTNAKGHRDIHRTPEATGTSAARHGLVTAHSAAAAEVRQPLYCDRFHYKQSSRFNCARARTLGGASSPMGIGLAPCEPPVLWLSRG
ncbi:hypothetical protein Trihar35433_9213 [Trichoderma harzianum]|nr:hypothetical protein Trihar35433_9213 [Trichoderma harzianum]